MSLMINTLTCYVGKVCVYNASLNKVKQLPLNYKNQQYFSPSEMRRKLPVTMSTDQYVVHELFFRSCFSKLSKQGSVKLN